MQISINKWVVIIVSVSLFATSKLSVAEILFIDTFPSVLSDATNEQIEKLHIDLTEAFTIKSKPESVADKLKKVNGKIDYYKNIKANGIEAIKERVKKEDAERAKALKNTLSESDWKELRAFAQGEIQTKAVTLAADYLIGVKKFRLAGKMTKNMANIVGGITTMESVGKAGSDGAKALQALTENITGPMTEGVTGTVMVGLNEIPALGGEGSMLDSIVGNLEKTRANLVKQSEEVVSVSDLMNKNYSLREKGHSDYFEEFKKSMEKTSGDILDAFPPPASAGSCGSDDDCSDCAKTKNEQCQSDGSENCSEKYQADLEMCKG